MAAPVRLDQEGAVAVITLDRPDVLNAFDEALTSALAAAVRETGGDDAVRAVVDHRRGSRVLRGAGSA